MPKSKKKLHYTPGDNRDQFQDYLDKEDREDKKRRIKKVLGQGRAHKIVP